MDDINFGKKLREIRINAGKSVPEISEHLTSLGYKAASQTIYGWERGHSQPTADTVMAMCEFYGVEDVLYAFGYKNSPDTEEPVPGDDEILRIYEALNTMLVSAGVIKDGEDITERQSNVLIALCRIIDATFGVED